MKWHSGITSGDFYRQNFSAFADLNPFLNNQGTLIKKNYDEKTNHENSTDAYQKL